MHLCTAPKCNAVDVAWNSAKAFVEAHLGLEPPLCLRNAPTKLMTDLGYKRGYRYAHDEPQGYPAGDSHNRWPEGVAEQAFYRPTTRENEAATGHLMQQLSSMDGEADRHLVDDLANR